VPAVGGVVPQVVDIAHTPLVVVQLPELHDQLSRHSTRGCVPYVHSKPEG
jgi:hypothetical protein